MSSDTSNGSSSALDRLGALSPEKRAAIEKLLKQQGASLPSRAAVPALAPIVPLASREGALPLSFDQQRVWFLNQMEPRGAAFNLQLRLVAMADVEALRRALAHAVGRHEVLRTTYRLQGREPVQVVHASMPVDLEVVDLSSLPDEEVASEAVGLVRQHRDLPFDLVHGPVWRAVVLKLSQGRTALCMTIHHIATDGWSINRLATELRESCEALMQHREPNLPPPPLQYADYAAWQRNWLQGDMLEQQLAYWRGKLAGMPQVLDLQTDFPRPPIQTHNGAGIAITLPAHVTAGLRALGQRHKATLFMTTLALYKVLLARNTGQFDVVVGTPIAGRTRPELENVHGLFLNSLVLRSDLRGNPTFVDVLGTVRDTVLGAFEHQDVPFEKVVEALQPQRDLSRNPLFQAFFTKPIIDQLAPRASGGIDGDAIPEGQAEFDLGLWVEEYADSVQLVFNYNTDLFKEDTIRRLAQQYERLALSVVADEQAKVGELEMLSPQQRQQILLDWNATEQPFELEPVSRLFEKQARMRSSAVALEFEGQRVTYGELNARANRLAKHLRAVVPGSAFKAGVYLQRGVEMVVAVLAVLKAGGAYVPLDPAYPADRVDYMLGDSEAAVLISEQSLLEGFNPGGARVVVVDRDAEAIARHGAQDLQSGPSPSELAYMIYTSGSTGKPKGVQIEHRSLSNFIESMARRPGLTSDDALLAVTTLSFDIAGLELYLPLCMGARIVLASRETASDGRALMQLLQGSGATVLQATPATWRLLMAAGWKGDGKLKALCGGEALPRELAEQLLQRVGQLWNMYGPTETTIWSTVHQVQSASGCIPVGNPVANTQVYVLDEHKQPVPPGVAGDLHIGGLGVARGYWGRPELTAERFIDDPFKPGGKLYYTGDRARWLADGSLDFLGRLDGQVKLRGYRIELGEIEAVLEKTEGVGVAVATVQERAGEQRLVGYVVRKPGSQVGADLLKEAASRQLPSFMVPTAWVFLERLPLTPNGKIDRKALPPPDTAKQPATTEEPRTQIEQRIAAIWRQVLQVERVGLNDNFFDLGGHSLLVVLLQTALREEFGTELPVVELFEYPTVRKLAERLGGDQPIGAGSQRGQERAAARRAGRSTDEMIAVIGMDGRFPGADNLEEFWKLLSEGREAISRFTDEELLEAGVPPELLSHPDYVKAKAITKDVDLFDASFFGYSPADAEAMDPQQRLFLQAAWASLEHAGYDADRIKGSVGVYAATSINSYSLQSVAAGGDLGTAFLNDKDFLATRVSYKLNLRGPSLNVQTACSSSLTAVVEACESLLAHRCDMALAGGVSISVPVVGGYVHQTGGVGSKDGHCRAFDAESSGCVPGSGVGVLVLKRLSQALADGDTVYAVIRGTGLNNDGADKVGFTAPSVAGQAEAISTALAVAGVDAGSIGYVETHGTGTVLGDPIEMAGLTQAFRATTDRTQFCSIGSLKTNIGHLDAAAGVAGLIKTVLCLHRKQLVPSLNFKQPNPKIDFAGSPFRVCTELTDWPAPAGRPRRAGVSSFGIGGTNVHVVLEEAPAAPRLAKAGEPQVLPLSARTDTALAVAQRRLEAHLRAHPEANLADVAHTLQLGRKAFEHRSVTVGGRTATGVAGEDADMVFMFSGQGTQYPNMTRGLYDTYPVFRQEVDRCARILVPHLGLDLRTLLYSQAPDAAHQLSQTANAQPALFVIEYALARLWMSWGVTPQAMIGHSLGEYVAACLAEVMTLDDALWLVALRARLMQAQPTGAMLGVPLPAEDVKATLSPRLSLAAVNSPTLCVVSGAVGDIDDFERTLAAAGVEGRRLHTSHAFHSAMMEPAAQAMAEAVGRVPLRAPRIPYVSNLTGRWITAEQATNPAYWGDHVRHAVQFSAGVGTLLQQPRMFLEIGPGHTLCNFVKQQPGAEGRAVVASVRHPQLSRDDAEFLLAALGQLWIAGKAIDWSALHAGQQRRRVPLPTYPFEGKRYWLPTVPGGAVKAEQAPQRPVDPASWCYVPGWASSAPLRKDDSPEGLAGPWLIYLHPGSLGERLAQRLQALGQRVVRVTAAPVFEKAGHDHFHVPPADAQAHQQLFATLDAAGATPARIVHAWSIGTDAQGRLDAALGLGFHSLLQVVQGVGKRPGDLPRIDVLTDRVQAVTGDEAVRAEFAPVLGLAKVASQEVPGLRCNAIDVDLPVGLGDERLLGMVLGELASAGTDPEVALRHRRRWLPNFDVLAPATQGLRLKQRGLYVITGGLGKVGLALAEYLASTQQARLVLIGRRAFPPRDAWEGWITQHGEMDATSQTLRRLIALEACGAQVMVAKADVTDEAQMRTLATHVSRRFGRVNGVIHAAGVLDGPSLAPIARLTHEDCAAQFAPKAHGLQVLDTAFDAPTLDFFMLVSSLSTVLGGLGFAAYAAANQYMDALCHRRHAEGRTHWMSVNWDAWRFHELSSRRSALETQALSARDGVRVFEHLLRTTGLPQVVVSTSDLAARRAQWTATADEASEPSAEPEAATKRHPRPRLQTAYAAPQTDTQRKLVAIWRDLFKIEDVGIHDNFFDLGGHSLLAIQAVGRLRSTCGVALALDKLLELNTIAQLATHVDALQWASQQPQAAAQRHSTDERDEFEL